ncbi:TspO/MBR family protein [Croceicoccus sp. BE223]|uniref:TspO/MBR family protein n=1 Tax=Croceicoccus sp. BE223 TaxID=2817716 RepID=UPI0028555B1C|nr:TspO/MBR family protein [Croceicoccus sp. BE223]MDR7103587.1 tryptophan-rich sensory protein [Croceicoccus sp. BE223]
MDTTDHIATRPVAPAEADPAAASPAVPYADRRPEARSVLKWAILTVPLVVVLGLASGWASGSGANSPWFDALVKPDIYPPSFLFGIVWTILYVLIGFSLAFVLATPPHPLKRFALTVFAAQLFVNVLWSPLFFGAQLIAFAFFWIVLMIALVIATMAYFAKISRMAALLLVPYLAWISFAAVLNLQFWQLN